MALVQGWLPPSRENWELLVWAWQLFPVVRLLQLLWRHTSKIPPQTQQRSKSNAASPVE